MSVNIIVQITYYSHLLASWNCQFKDFVSKTYFLKHHLHDLCKMCYKHKLTHICLAADGALNSPLSQGKGVKLMDCDHFSPTCSCSASPKDQSSLWTSRVKCVWLLLLISVDYFKSVSSLCWLLSFNSFRRIITPFLNWIFLGFGKT